MSDHQTHRLSGRGRFAVAAAAFVCGGGLAGVAFAAALLALGPAVLCTKGLLCQQTNYRDMGAAHAVHLVLPPDLHTSFTVVWETPRRQAPPLVRYRAPGEAWRFAEGRSRPAPRNGLLASASHIHTATADGLDAGAGYEYQVSWDDGGGERAYSQTFRTRTLARGQAVKAAFVSDICLRARPDGLSGPIDRIIADLARERIDVLLGGGDYACAGNDGRTVFAEPAIQSFFEEWREVMTATPFVGQYGNLECCHGETTRWWTPRLAHAAAPWRTADGRSFAFDIGETTFVGLYAPGVAPFVSPGHAAWLDETLAAAETRGQLRRIVYHHAPLVSTGRRHPPDAAFRSEIVPVLERRRVDLSLSGHDMSYERTLPVTDAAEGAPTIGAGAAAAAWPGVVYAKVSPAGRRTSDRDNVPDDMPAHIAAADDQRFVYAVLTIAPGGTIEVVAYGYDRDGVRTVVDRFRIG